MALTKIMDAMKRMEVVWPSAGRAWELLDGARDNLTDVEPERIADLSGRRNKRTAGDSFSEAADGEMARGPDVVQGFPAAVGYHPAGLPFSSNGQPSPPYFGTYERFASDIPLTLSTSVLPQQYSTGFGSERGVPGDEHVQSSMSAQGRYPQYWSDYTLGQPSSMLGSMYGMSILPPQVPHGCGHPQQHGQHPQPTSQQQQLPGESSMYMGDQFNLFSESLSLCPLCKM